MTIRVETFNTLPELEAKHGWSGAMGVYAGPIHQHGNQKFIQVYIGQHEWLAVCVDDPKDVRPDPGYKAKVFGHGIVLLSGEDRWLYCDHKKTLPEPVADHPSITHDELMFGDRKTVETYLGKSLKDLNDG